MEAWADRTHHRTAGRKDFPRLGWKIKGLRPPAVSDGPAGGPAGEGAHLDDIAGKSIIQGWWKLVENAIPASLISDSGSEGEQSMADFLQGRFARLSGKLVSVAAAASMLALTAAAQPQARAGSEGESDDIVVTGSQLSREQAREQATAFVEATGVASGRIPAARWLIPVCPKVGGLVPEAARAAERKLRAIADEAGVELAPTPCDANLVMNFVPDADAAISEIARRSPRRLAELSNSARKAVINGDAPIRWWYTTETMGRHGQRSRFLSAPRSQMDGGHSEGGSAIPVSVPTMMHYQSSQISTLSQRSLVSASIIIDETAVIGLPLDTVAAYAALVGLAEIRDPSARPTGSILAQFDSPATPTDLTRQDKAFLKALYRMPLDRQAMRHRGRLVRDISGELVRGQN